MRKIKNSKRRGVLYVSRTTMEENRRELLKIFRHAIVLRAEFRYDIEMMMYIFEHPMLDTIRTNEISPEYDVIYHRSTNGEDSFEFVRK